MKYLSGSGVAALWNKCKATFATPTDLVTYKLDTFPVLFCDGKDTAFDNTHLSHKDRHHYRETVEFNSYHQILMSTIGVLEGYRAVESQGWQRFTSPRGTWERKRVSSAWSAWTAVATGVDVTTLSTELNRKSHGASALGTYASAGWYRVAQYKADSVSTAKGAQSNSAYINIKTNYENNENVTISLLLSMGHHKARIIPINVNGALTTITKVRLTADETNFVTYLEIYYVPSASNRIRTEVIAGGAGYSTTTDNKFEWLTITPVKTSETASGVTVIATINTTTDFQMRPVQIQTTDPGAGATSTLPDGSVIMVYE